MPNIKKKIKFPYSYYAKKYGISISTAERWHIGGAPLDSDEKLFEWVSQRGRVPQGIRFPGKKWNPLKSGETFATDPQGRPRARVQRRSLVAPKPSRTQGKAKPGKQEETPPGVQGTRAIIQGRGLRAEIERQEAECEQAYLNYRAASDNEDHIAMLTNHKVWVAAQKSLRELAKDVPKSENEDAKVLNISEVESTWAKALSEMKTQLESLPATIALELAGVEPEVRVQVETLAMDEVTRIIAAMQKSPWLK